MLALLALVRSFYLYIPVIKSDCLIISWHKLQPRALACISSQSFVTACSGSSTESFGSNSRFFSLSPKVFRQYSFQAGPINWDVANNGCGSFNRVRRSSCIGLTGGGGGGGGGGICRQHGLPVFTCLASVNRVPSTSGKKCLCFIHFSYLSTFIFDVRVENCILCLWTIPLKQVWFWFWGASRIEWILWFHCFYVDHNKLHIATYRENVLM